MLSFGCVVESDVSNLGFIFDLFALPETNSEIIHEISFWGVWGPIFRGELLVLGRVIFGTPPTYHS